MTIETKAAGVGTKVQLTGAPSADSERPPRPGRREGVAPSTAGLPPMSAPSKGEVGGPMNSISPGWLPPDSNEPTRSKGAPLAPSVDPSPAGLEPREARAQAGLAPSKL